MTVPYVAGEELKADDYNALNNYIWIPASQFSIVFNNTGAAAFGAFGGWSNTSQAWAFPDGNLTLVLTQFFVPQTGTIKVEVYFQGGGSGNFRLGVDLTTGRTPGTPGDTMFINTLLENVTIPSYNGLARWQPTGTRAVDAGDLVNIDFSRNGGDALDTSSNTLYFYGIKAYYV